jgi:hypothetical protein
MKILLRTKLFDFTSGIEEGSFYGEDFAEWLSRQLIDWETSYDCEDWGWSLCADKNSHVYIFGIYDHDTDDVDDHGPQWCIRVYNQRDWRS